MTRARALVFGVSALLLAAQPLVAQDLAEYRGFRLGGTLASVAKMGGVTPAEARLIHQRPAVLQDLRWRPPVARSREALEDPVREVTFSFYNDALFRIVVEYDRQRTAGLTDTDLIEALSATYGPPLLARRDFAPVAGPERDPDPVVARWADADSSVTLLRSTYPTSVRLVVTATRVDALAQVALTEALRQDELEAPQRERDQEQKRVDDRLLLAAQAREVNKPAFKP